MGLSLKEQFALLSKEEQEQFLNDAHPDVIEQMARGEWWWESRPEQVPPEGDWLVFLFLGGRGTGKTRSGAEWLVNRTLSHPYDTSGFPVERLVMAYNLSDARQVCIEGASGVLRVLDRLGYEEILGNRVVKDLKNKYHYTKSPKPHITILETGAKIYFTGADPDAARGYNLADVWCVAQGETVATARGLVPVEEVTTSDLVVTDAGFRRVTAATCTKKDALVLRISTEAGDIRVTPDHRVWTRRGWIMASDVVRHDTMVTCLPQVNQLPVTLPPSTSGMGKPGSTTSGLGQECDPSSVPTNAATLPPPALHETNVLHVGLESSRYDVYDLTIEGEHHFFAGSGLLKIHNCDEIVKWADPSACWKEGIMPALRADIPGDKPRAFITTTPKPITILQEWVQLFNNGSPKINMSRGSTFDNALNLSQDFLDEVAKAYEGTALGRQELYGEMLDTLEGALFSYSSIEKHRVSIGPEQVAHRAVGVDPGLTGAEDGDEMGVVVASRSHDDHIYILADRTTRMAGRDAAVYAWRIFEEFQADTLVYESNLGKAWMEQVFTDAYAELQRSGVFPMDTTPPLVAVFSNQGKKLRAEPVAMRYSQGRVHHMDRFDELEKQMLAFDPITSKVSPDRLDALVHVCRHLMEGEKRRSRIISPLGYQIKRQNYGM